MLDSKVISFAYQSIWEQVEAGEQNKPVPAGRGGHQMCIDDVRGKIYMYGGWDGKENMGDFWEFDIMEMQWRCLGIDNAPGKRSLHSMCFDSINNRLYVIGRYYDQEHRASTSLESDMYMYDVNENKWYLESANTERCNGPKMQYDAQMVFDELNQCIYLYGGKIIQPGSADTGTMYGGLYRYDTKSGEWTSLRADMHIYDHETQVTGRFFHSMTIDPRVQRLYIMSNYRDRTAAGDMFVYDIETDTFFERTRNMIAKSPPSILSSCRGSSSPICNIFGSRMSTKITGLNYMLSKKPLSTPCGIDGHADSCSAYKRWYTKNGYNLSSSEYNKPQLNPLQMAASASVQHNSYSLKITLDRSRNELYLLTSHGFEPTVHSNNEFYPISDLHSVDVSYDSSLLDTLPNHVRCPTQNHVSMSILTYQFEADAWQENYNSDFTIPDNRNPITPPPRYAQAMVYSERLACHFMFGGNSGVKSSSRLNDLWILRLRRPLSDSILRNSLFLVRAKKFLELCHLSSFTSCVNNNTNPSPSHSSSSTPSLSQISNIFVKDNTILSDQLLRKNIYQDQAMECLNFLRSKVSVLVDHENHAESAAYRALTNHLISKFGSTMIGTLDAFGGSVDNSLDAFSSFGSEPDFLRSNRRSLFDSLVENFFPEGSYNSKRNIVF
ncbi:Muskelin [Zancudomyces culisetae]|uniref:Muskelin n=1 Tax=Zancudomyces culisetae TaxID=1213189 RepID=A0A1R1PZQ1_ZANCU|nr:Muskelin [Zancudomyces culisetae]|eukprot:OMH86417.1 Muskelin [Zancudomyces culisetae]